jgi:hypothetical protein
MLRAQQYRESLPRDRLLVLRYEDAAMNPQQAAKDMWSFLGIAGMYDVENRGAWRDAYGKPWHANSSFHRNEDTAQFDRSRAIERWRQEISTAELALTEIVCGELMAAHGYERSGGADWSAAKDLVGDDPLVSGYLRHWETTGEGIEAFPTDPLDPRNWRDE